MYVNIVRTGVILRFERLRRVLAKLSAYPILQVFVEEPLIHPVITPELGINRNAWKRTNQATFKPLRIEAHLPGTSGHGQT
jgi:hypothetical protein